MGLNQIPDFVRPSLWSYDLDSLDLHSDRKSIVFGVLNNGSEKACRWLMQTYSTDIIKQEIKNSIASSWDQKSLNLWSIVFEVYPERITRDF